MNFWKRWSSSITGRIDAMVARVENHDALVHSAIRELQAKLARSQVQLSQVQRDGCALKERLEAQITAEIQWKERAKKCLAQEERALQCLHRSKLAARSVQILRARIEEHNAIEARLEQDVQLLQEGLQDLKEQRNMMRARQTRAEAMGVVRDNQGEMAGDIQEVLQRWEVQIKESEFDSNSPLEPVDQLAESFSKDEEREALLSELQQMRRSHD